MSATKTPIDSWSNFAEVYGSVATTGRPLMLAQARHAEATHAISIRYLEGVTQAMRISWQGRTLKILSAVDPDRRKRELVIDAQEIF